MHDGDILNQARRQKRGPQTGAQGPAAARVRDLHKSYGHGPALSHALIGIDVSVAPGEVVGVLGPNGAGKTTLLSILEGLRRPDYGEVEIFGVDVLSPEGLTRVRPRIGVSMQNSVLPPLITPRELLTFKAALYDRRRDIDELIEQFGLGPKADAQYRHLSGGQQQRVVLAMALAGDPDLLFLDEPTSQLDPQARQAAWQAILAQRRRRNAAVLVATHQMEEAERLCDRVLVIDKGRIIAEGPPRQLVAEHCPEQAIEFQTLNGPSLTEPGDGEVIGASGEVVTVRLRPASVDDRLLKLLEQKSRGELVVDNLRLINQTLEDVFIKLTGRSIRS